MSTTSKYFGNFSDASSVEREFSSERYYGKGEPSHRPIEGFPTDEEILFAAYFYESYEGSANVLFQRGGVLYEVVGGHCSCNGLENQWKPGVVTWAALAMRPRDGWDYDLPRNDEAKAAFFALVDANTSGVKA